MEYGKSMAFKLWTRLFALGTIIAASGCSTPQLPAGMLGRLGRYDYSPSVIQTGNLKQFWWCGDAVNPVKSSQDTDTIQYESIDLATGAKVGPITVMAETPGAWDSVYTCNPKVIGGVFDNPLGDGQSFQYAMYYVGTADGATNDIGVAFSKDGIEWHKYPDPVIRKGSPTGYGVGQPSLYNTDHKAGISMFYEDSNPVTHHVAATSTDGLHFSVLGTLTTNGLDTDCPDPSWGDMAFDNKTDSWYAVFNRSLRDASTTGGITERGQLGVELYKIPNEALLTGAQPWQQLAVIDTNLTGFESNFIAAFVHDPYGNVNVGPYPTIQMYVSVSNPQPAWNVSPAQVAISAFPDRWDIAPVEWVPDQPLLALYRYFNTTVHEVTTGWVSPRGGFQPQLLLGHLYQSLQQGADVPFYACKKSDEGFFVSLDSACEGERILGTNGYGYSHPVSGLHLIALYRCSTGHDHFVSQDPNCEGAKTDELLGYVLP